MKQLQLKTIVFLVSLSTLTSLVFAQLSTNRAVIKNNMTQRIVATANFATQKKGDLYLATLVNNSLIFFANEGKELTLEPTPFYAR